MAPVYNFSAGPSILPKEVFKEASEAVLNFNNSGLSILEISHRSKDFIKVMDECEADLRSILDIPKNYKVLFLGGGASSQFNMIPLNILANDEAADYMDTGAWAKKASKEAARYGKMNIAGSSADKNYNYIPKDLKLTPNAKYLHVTSNNTIYGTQMKNFPTSSNNLVADMSSDILSKKIDVSKFGIIYAGAQKNMGPAGVTIVIVREDLLNSSKRDDIPTILNYATHASKGSMFNTPPVYAIYVTSLVLKWIKDKGGIEVIEKMNDEKAKLLYDTIDASKMFKATAALEDRSNMNVTFVIGDDELEKKFIAGTAEKGLSGLKGHRDVGGFRASIYNAHPIEGVQALVDYIKEFEAANS